MKENSPVTNTEQIFSEHEILISESDLKGNITVANTSFCLISGFSETDLIGKSLTALHHPDMPATVVKDLWQTVQNGQQWVGIVKNRCSNGSFCWVKAHVSPVYEAGVLVVYRLIGTKPSREEVSETEMLYQQLNQNPKLKINTIRSRKKEGGFLGRVRVNEMVLLLAVTSVVANVFTILLAKNNIESGQYLSIVLSLGMLIISLLFLKQFKRQSALVLNGLRAVTNGDISQGIELYSDSEMGKIAGECNLFLSNINSFTGEVTQSLLALANGDLERKIVSTMSGDLNQAKNAANSSLTSLVVTIEIIENVLNGLKTGDLKIKPIHKNHQLHGRFLDMGAMAFDVVTTINRVTKDITNRIDLAYKGDFGHLSKQEYTGVYEEIIHDFSKLNSLFEVWLNEMLMFLKKIEQGDLIPDSGHTAFESSSLDGVSGKFSELKEHSHCTLDNLTTLVNSIRNVSESMFTAVSEIAAGNTDLSQRTEEQAASLEETAASMEQLATTLKNNAEVAIAANSLAKNSEIISEKTGEEVNEIINAMNRISASSATISEIISVIDGIAFQTNILALNAAVEAARAGEHGKGFAVVAGEVRTLAQKCALAAKEIKQLISESDKQIRKGSELINNASLTIHELSDSVSRMNVMMNDISTRSIEQSAGIDQVNLAISQMDAVTQQNAALVEQSSAASTSLEHLSASLMESVGMFKLSNTSPLKTPAIRTTKKGVSSYSESEWQEY